MSRHTASAALLVVALASATPDARADVLTVPGDFADLQAALDAAAFDDTILVSGFHDQVTVTQQVSIIGNPVFSIEAGCLGGGFGPPGSAVTLAGPGSGKVVVSGLDSTSFDCFLPAPAISGGGFDELHLYDSEILMLSGQSGIGDSNDAIAVSVPYVQIANSSVRGAQPSSDDCTGFQIPGVYAAVRASGTVVVLDSQIRGGEAFVYCSYDSGCPSPLPTGGEGGHGVVADVVLVDESLVIGGPGETFFADGGATPCGTKPDGQAIIASAVHTLPSLTGSRAVDVGDTWSFSFQVPGPQAFLFLSVDNIPPLHLPAKGWLFLAPSSVIYLTTVPVGLPTTLDVPIPNDANLIGADIAFQIFDQTVGLTEPAFALLGG